MKKFIICIFSVLCLVIIPTYCGVMRSDAIFAETAINLAETSKSALLVDFYTGTVLYEKNIKARLPIASMVKLMTILLTYEAIDNEIINLDSKITTSENASGMGGSQVFIDPYVEYKAGDLLKGVIISSANDASVALAEAISGSEDEFVRKMNIRAAELGMKNTLYANATGLPAPESYSCAEDCAIILKEVVKYNHYKTISNIWMDELVHPSGRKTELVNTNKLIRYYNGCDGGKTGSTSEAGYCLTATAQKGDLRLISVVIGSPSGQERFKEASNMFNYGFANFENKAILNTNSACHNIELNGCKKTELDVYATESYYGLCKKGEKAEYSVLFEVDKNIKAPLKSGTIVGVAIISKNGKVLKEINLIIKEDAEKLTYLDQVKQIISKW